MGLQKSDQIPTGISAKDAYEAIRSWYQANCGLFPEGSRTSKFIQALPPADELWDADMKAVFREVMCGCLEGGYHESDGKFKMGAYAHTAWNSMMEGEGPQQSKAAPNAAFNLMMGGAGIFNLSHKEQSEVEEGPLGAFFPPQRPWHRPR